MGRRNILAFVSCLIAVGCGTPEKLLGENWNGPPESAFGREYTPEAAVRRGIAGWVMLQCRVGAQQTLQFCRILHEEPEGWGFGEAALTMREGFKIQSRGSLPYSPEAGAIIQIPVIFCPPERMPACHGELKAAANGFDETLSAVAGLMRAGRCDAAVELARASKAPRLAAIVEAECAARTRVPPPV